MLFSELLSGKSREKFTENPPESFSDACTVTGCRQGELFFSFFHFSHAARVQTWEKKNDGCFPREIQSRPFSTPRKDNRKSSRAISTSDPFKINRRNVRVLERENFWVFFFLYIYKTIAFRTPHHRVPTRLLVPRGCFLRKHTLYIGHKNKRKKSASTWTYPGSRCRSLNSYCRSRFYSSEYNNFRLL